MVLMHDMILCAINSLLTHIVGVWSTLQVYCSHMSSELRCSVGQAVVDELSELSLQLPPVVSSVVASPAVGVASPAVGVASPR